MAFAPSPLPSSRPAKKTTILLVDDDSIHAYAHRAALERDFANLVRAANASEAFIRLDEPGFSEKLALIVVGLRLPGLAGPAFVNELTARAPSVPVLVIGRPGETAAEYSGGILFLSDDASAEGLLEGVKSFFSKARRFDGLRFIGIPIPSLTTSHR